MTYVFAPGPTQLYLLFADTSMTPFKARCMGPIIQKTSGRMCTTFRWLIIFDSMNSGHVHKIKVSSFVAHLYSFDINNKYPADINERDSLEIVRKQVRKLIIRGLSM